MWLYMRHAQTYCKALLTKNGIWSARDVQSTSTHTIQATGADAKGFASLAAAFTFTWKKAAITVFTCHARNQVFRNVPKTSRDGTAGNKSGTNGCVGSLSLSSNFRTWNPLIWLDWCNFRYPKLSTKCGHGVLVKRPQVSHYVEKEGGYSNRVANGTLEKEWHATFCWTLCGHFLRPSLARCRWFASKRLTPRVLCMINV